MKICIAQTKSEKGKIQENIHNHLQMVERAIKSNSDVIIFPELSITNYEPELAKELATNIENNIFNPFQELSNNNEITIGIGMPTKVADGINISMLIFQPNKKSVAYSKQMLHLDELPYFVCGNNQVILNSKGHKIAIGICYETLQLEHFLNTNKNGADIYIASVAKPKEGIEKAYKHFPKIAKEFNTTILMSNCVGYCDNFMSVGQSAVWNKKGELIKQLDNQNQGLLIYDTETELTEVSQPKIVKGQLSDLGELFQIYLNGKIELEKKGIYQWTNNYPTKTIIESDLRKGVLYILKNCNEIIGAINISEEQEAEYQKVDWKFDDSKVLVIHRLVTNPKYQRKGYAKKLMDFAENFAKENKYTSIRLDTYSQNEGAIKFYKKRNYVIRGNVNFPEREFAFHCMEKEIKLPEFKYSPNAYELDLFVKVDGICSVCKEKRSLKYNSSFYSADEPEYICPWCIANGKASEKYDGEFNDYCGIEGVSPNPNDSKPTISEELLLEVTNKTPSYSSWQQEQWLSHCNEPCAFIGYADSETIKPILNEVKDDIEKLEIPIEWITKGLTNESDLGVYLFQCCNCKKHRLHIDFP